MNTFIKNLSKTYCLLIVVFIVQGCNEKQTENNNANEQIRPGLAESGYVKPHAPVYLGYDVPAMEVGIQAEIQLKVSSGKKVDDLMISYFTEDETVQLHNARTQISFGPQEKNQINTHTLIVVPAAEGEFMIFVSVTAIKNAKSQGRSFVIPVRVGNVRKQKALKSSGEITTDSTGTPIISMPAVETTD